MNTEIIASVKGVVINNKELCIVTTMNGAEVWVPKTNMDQGAETVSYKHLEAGSEYTTKAGEVKQLTKARNELVGFGKATKADNAIKVFMALNAIGIVPAIAL